MATLKSLATRMERIAKRLPEETARITAGAAAFVGKKLIEKTPVDTSLALSNWQASIGGPVNSPIDAYFLGQGGSTAGASRGAAIAALLNAVAGYKAKQGIWISNLIHYVSILNTGTSTQAPAGFIEAVVKIDVRQYFKSVKFNLQ